MNDDDFEPFKEPVAPDAGSLPIYKPSDVDGLLPFAYQKSENRPVLDALIEALTEMAIAWEDAGTVAAIESDMATATALFLDGQADDRDLHRAENEDVEAFRERALVVPSAVDRMTILTEVNAILAPFTPIEARIFDSILDRWFVTNGTAVYHSFVGATPQYLDRLYPGDAALNGGMSRPLSDSGGAYAYNGTVGRQFVLRVPDISPIENVHAFCYDETPVGSVEHRLFVGDGSQSVVAAYVSKGNSTALAVYQSITDKVNVLCGHSIRWSLVVDPNLTA